MPESLKVAIVDDHSIFRTGLRQSTGRARGLEIVAEGENAAQAIEIVRQHAPDIILLDINMPGDSLIAAREIKDHYPMTKVIMLTVSESEDHLTAAFRNGASGYLLKGVTSADLVRTLWAISKGATYAEPVLAARTLFNQIGQKSELGTLDRTSELSQDERELAQRVAEGLSNKEIARSLGISINVVKNRLCRIMRILHANNRTMVAVELANRIGQAGPRETAKRSCL